MNICITCGARPNFVKVAPLVWAMEKARKAGESLDYKIVYTGRTDDSSLEPGLFDDLGIRRPDVYLNADDESLNVLAGNVMFRFDAYLTEHPTDVVLVVDDLASTMAVAITTKKRGIRLAHLVAGTRSFDMTMPKEINRLVIDGLSDLLFTAGVSNDGNVNREGAEMSKTYMVGNILIDTLRRHRDDLRCPAVFDTLELGEKPYLLLTLNRKALLSDEAKLQSLLKTLVAHAAGRPVVAPLRSRAARVVARLCLEIHVVNPLPYLEFGYLAAHAAAVVTDSGNVAEEATFNQVPCITLNSYTEHEETVTVGTNVLVGENAETLACELDKLTRGEWKTASLPERWDGRSAERIVHILLGK